MTWRCRLLALLRHAAMSLRYPLLGLGRSYMHCSPLHDLSFCEINRRWPGVSGCWPVGDGFATNSPAPLTLKTEVTPSGSPCPVRKPSHARAPAIRLAR